MTLSEMRAAPHGSQALQLAVVLAFANIAAFLAGWGLPGVDIAPLAAAVMGGGLAWWAAPRLLPAAWRPAAFVRATALASLALLALLPRELPPPGAAGRLSLAIEGLAEHNPQAKSSEVWLVSARHADGGAADAGEFHSDGPWERRDALWVFYAPRPATLSWAGRNGMLALHFQTHPWSGKVRITSSALAEPLTVDLYSPEGGEKVVELRNGLWTPYALLLTVSLGIALVTLAGAWRRRVPPLPAFWDRALLVVLPAGGWLLANLLLLDHPGMSPDSMWQFMQAARPGVSILTPLLPPHKPPFMSLMMAWPVQSFGVRGYLLLQSALFYAAIALLLARLLPAGPIRRTLLALLCLHPLLMVLAMTVWSDIPMAALLLLALAEGLAFARTGRLRPLLGGLILLFLGLSLRFNGLVVVPVVLLGALALLLRPPPGAPAAFRRRVAAALLAIPLLVPATGLWNHHPKVESTVSLLPWAIVNQYVGTLRLAAANGKSGDPVFQEQRRLADANFGPGVLDKMFATFQPVPDYVAWVYRSTFLGLPQLVLAGGFMVEQLPRVVMAFPKEFLAYKRAFIAGILERSQPYLCLGFCLDLHPAAEEMAALRLGPDTPLPAWRQAALARLAGLQAPLATLRHLAVSNMLLWCALFSLGGLLLRDRAAAFVAAIGFVYGAGYLTVDMGPEWRYFLPTFLCFAAAAARLLATACRPQGEAP